MVTPRPSLRVMVDANILIAGSVWPIWPHEILKHAIAADFQLVLSPYIISQARKRLESSFPDNAWRLEQILTLVDFEAVDDPGEKEIKEATNLVRDPTDISVALAAINAGVDYLVSEDKDLTAKNKTTEKLRQQVRVLISGTFLRQVMGWSNDDLEEVKGRLWEDMQPNQIE